MLFIPLLDIMNREKEFQQTVDSYTRLFPDSDIQARWYADFYLTRDQNRFAEIMRSDSFRSVSRNAQEHYLYMLCGEKKYTEAVKFCAALKSDLFFRNIIPEIIRASGNINSWRKILLEGAAENEPGLYYSLGLAEMVTGLDPVMYWEKGYSLDDEPELMRDLSDIYENGIIGENDYYSGAYTDLHPEFGWNAKKRKVSIHIFESGRIILEGEDQVPSGKKIRREKYSEGGSEFSEGEIRTGIPYFKGLKVLYVMTAKDGLPAAVSFESALSGGSRLYIKYKCSGDEEYSVIKYSGEYRSDKKNLLMLFEDLQLKAPEEKISWFDFEVICHGEFTPKVIYNGKQINPGNFSEGIIRYKARDEFSPGDKESAAVSVWRFADSREFAGWYSRIIKYTETTLKAENQSLTTTVNIESFIRKLQGGVITSILKKGNVDLNPGDLNSVISRGVGTVEERTLLAKAILGKYGIQSFIAFVKNRTGLTNRILLYVPETRDRGYWISFYGEGISDENDSGNEAIVITGEGYNTLPVVTETYIR